MWNNNEGRMKIAFFSLSVFVPALALLAAPTLVPAPRQATYGRGVFEGPVEARAVAERTIVRDAALPADGYAISVTTNSIGVRAGGPAGEFYARTTLRQLVATNAFGATASVVEIVDSPAYPWRALMLDEGRHFFGKETVKDLIARMAEHKLNVLHWHLTEDQGWRLDIPGHPELVRYGAKRRASVRYRTSPYWPDGDYAPFKFDENGEPYGPYFYTPEDIREILAFAKEHFVKIVPEIELPGHVRALLAAHPEFSCVGEELPREPRVWWGVERDVICAGNEEALKFLEEILDRVCEMFPDADIIHIGGDECPKDRWSACPKCQARIRAEGLKDVHELQSYVTMRMANHLKKRGRRTMGYDAVLIGGALDASIQVNWRKPRKRSTVTSACQAAELGHDVALIEDDFAYFDYSQGLADDPCYYIPGRGAITLEDVYALDPSRGLTAKARPHLVGAEACLWSEYIWNRLDLEWKTWPRACAFAEALWTGAEKPGFDDFVRRMNRHRGDLVADGVNCAPLSYRTRTLVANPTAQPWPAPSFFGKPFWPTFYKLYGGADDPKTPDGRWGFEDLAMVKERATHYEPRHKPGLSKYRFEKGNVSGRANPVPAANRFKGDTYRLWDIMGPGFAELVYGEFRKDAPLLEALKGAPLLLRSGDSRPAYFIDEEFRADVADFAAWREKHPEFVGFTVMEEIDSDSGNLYRMYKGEDKTRPFANEEMKRDLLSRYPLPKNRRETFANLERMWKVSKAHCFDAPLWGLYCNNNSLSHIFAELGAAGLENENSASQSAPWAWSGAYTRGASRQYGIPFMWYTANFSGTRNFRRGGIPCRGGDNVWPRDGRHTAKRPAWIGASRSLMQRQQAYGWLIGAGLIQPEGFTMWCSSATNGVACPSPFAADFNEVFEWSKKVDRGAPYTPIAMLAPLMECVGRGGYVSGERDTLNLPAWYFTLVPVKDRDRVWYPLCHSHRSRGDEGCLFNSPFGEIWDVLVPDAPRGKAKLGAALAHYPAAFLIGTYEKGELDVAVLEKYVRDGGTLFLSADYVDAGLVPAALSGVTFAPARMTSGHDLIDERGARVEALDGAYALRPAAELQGARPWLRDELGQTVAFAHDLGKGRVVTTACHRSMPAAFGDGKALEAKVHQKLLLDIRADEADLGLIRYLLARVQRETIPFAVEGDIEWGLGKTADGWMMWFFNNKGVVKFVGEDADYDVSKTADVTVSAAALRKMSVTDALTGETLPTPAGLFKLTVGPGKMRFVTIKEKSSGK